MGNGHEPDLNNPNNVRKKSLDHFSQKSAITITNLWEWKKGVWASNEQEIQGPNGARSATPSHRGPTSE